MDFAYLIEPPFNYRSADGRVTGCDVELARVILGRLGIEDIRFHETEFAELLPGVRDGRWRMTTGLFATEERERLASFSRPIWALPDGLLVAKGDAAALSGYASLAEDKVGRLAVVRDQVQHKSALERGVQPARITVCETYIDAAKAVASGAVRAFASVARAHLGYIEQSSADLAVVTVPPSEKAPAFGSFAFARLDNDFRRAVDRELQRYIGSAEHRAMMGRFGFTDAEVDLVARSV